jgi:hypothetical protein
LERTGGKGRKGRTSGARRDAHFKMISFVELI